MAKRGRPKNPMFVYVIIFGKKLIAAFFSEDNAKQALNMMSRVYYEKSSLAPPRIEKVMVQD